MKLIRIKIIIFSFIWKLNRKYVWVLKILGHTAYVGPGVHLWRDRTNARKRKLVETQASQRERFNEPATPEAIVGGIVLVFRVMNAKLNNIRRRTFTLAPRAFIDAIRASSRTSAISFRRASYIQKIIWPRMKKFRC